MQYRAGAAVLTAMIMTASGAHAATFQPAAVQPSSLRLQIAEVATVGTAAATNNYASPVVVHGDLHVIDQAGKLYRDNGAGFDEVSISAPAGITPTGRSSITNVAAGASADEVFVLYKSSSLPSGLSAAELPQDVPGVGRTGAVIDDLYDASGSGPDYQVLYRYTVSSGALTAPEAIAAFEVQATSGAHPGGGLVSLPDGRVLLATGDSLPFGLNGLHAPQDDTSHVSKLLLIDPATGDWEVAAKGLRNTQSLWLKEDGGKLTWCLQILVGLRQKS